MVFFSADFQRLDRDLPPCGLIVGLAHAHRPFSRRQNARLRGRALAGRSDRLMTGGEVGAGDLDLYAAVT